MVSLMTKDKTIFIKNIYYMLSYAFQVLRNSNYDSLDSEPFDHAQDLFAAILAKGLGRQVKQGLYLEYTGKEEDLTVMRGKLDVAGTIRNRIQRKQDLACEFDELSENNLYNRILKTTLHYLVRDEGVDVERKRALRKILVFFDRVEMVNPLEIAWSRLQYLRNNGSYELLINICYFVLDGMVQTTDKGDYCLMSFSDDQMAKLYEHFILEYYRCHHAYLNEVKAGQVKWDLSGEEEDSMVRFLPRMQTDVFLRMGERVLIIDAKFYSKTMHTRYDKRSLRSDHLYQMFAYVKNQDKERTGNVAGLILYAKTDEALTPDCLFDIGGNVIGAKTLDLNVDFREIAGQLDQIVEDFLISSEVNKLK